MNIKNEKGIALIMSIGIVAMLAIIGTTFAINMRLEQKASANYLVSIKAKALAEAGIDQAIAVMRLYAITQAYSAPNDNGWYLGDRDGGVITASPPTTLTTEIRDSRKTWTSNALQNYRLKLMDRANWIYNITSNTADTITCSNANFTGISSGEGYAIMDPTLGWGVKVIDCARQIYVNDFANTNLTTMLNNLCLAIGSPLVGSEGGTIVTSRPIEANGGYLTKESVKQVIGTDKYNAIKDYITVIGYVDANAPNFKRAPINVNTASQPVIRAILASVITETPPSDTKSTAVANDIINNNRRPFRTWKEFEDYINNVAPGGLTAADKTNIISNANPNRIKPGTYTTEFCFHSGGNYEIISTGMVYDLAGNKAAEKKTKAIANIFNVWKQTGQAQFAADRLYGLQATSDVNFTGIVTAMTIYDTGFESPYVNLNPVDTYGATNGWTALYGAPVVRNVNPHSGSLHLSLDTRQTAYINLNSNNNLQTRLLTMSAWLYSTNQAVATANLYMTDSGGVNYGPDVILGAAGKVMYRSGVGYSNVPYQNPASYSAGTWYPIRVVADLLGEVYWVYFNDMANPAVNGQVFYNPTGLQSYPTDISRIVLGNVSAAERCYADDFVVRCAGPINNNVTGQFLSPTPTGVVKKWGTVSWTGSPPDPGKGVKLELSSASTVGAFDWKGPSYRDKNVYIGLTFFGEDFYNIASGQGISTSHALDKLKYAASIYTIDATLAASALYDVTITYLPVTRILYWRGLGAGE